MLHFLSNPIRGTIEAVGLLMARLGFIDRQRAEETAELAWPRVVTGLARMSKSTVDVAMVGTALGASAIAGVGFATPYWLLAFIIGGGIAGGTISLVSQRFSAGDREGVSVAVKVSAIYALLCTVPIMAIFWVIPEMLIGVVGSDVEAITYGARYLQVVSISMPFAALNLIGSRTLVGANDARTPMYIRAGGAVINLGLNAVLIFVFDLGVVGAATGTVISNVLATIVFLWGLTSGRLPGIGELPLRIEWNGPHWEPKTARDLAAIATPLTFTNLGQLGGQFPMLAIVSLFGPQVVAAFVIALRVRDLMNTPGWGFGLASSSLVGQQLGRGAETEAGGYARDGLRFAVAVYVVAAVGVFLFAGPVSHLFVNDPSLYPLTETLIRITCVSVVFWGMMTGALGPLRASGDTRWPFYGQMIGLFAFALPMAYLGATTSLGLTGLYLALILETGVPAAITYYRYRSDAWKAISRRYRPATP